MLKHPCIGPINTAKVRDRGWLDLSHNAPFLWGKDIFTKLGVGLQLTEDDNIFLQTRLAW